MRVKHFFLFFGLATFIGSGCSPSESDYKATVKNGIQNVPHVQEMLNLFPGALTHHMILGFDDWKKKPSVWSTDVYFGEKYILSYQVHLNIDFKKHQIGEITAKPIIHLFRVGRVVKASSDTLGADFSEDHKFDESAWEKVVAAHGDFSVIGIKVDTNSVVPGFEEFAKGEKASRTDGEEMSK